MTRRRAPQGGKCADPAWRHARAVKANTAARARYERDRETAGERYATKGVAYVAGYRHGYQTAMRWWARRAARDAERQRFKPWEDVT